MGSAQAGGRSGAEKIKGSFLNGLINSIIGGMPQPRNERALVRCDNAEGVQRSRNGNRVSPRRRQQRRVRGVGRR